MAFNGGIRSGIKVLISSETALPRSVSRGLHATGVKRMGGHGHGHDSEPYYIHAKYMYNLDRMKYQKIKMPLAVFAVFGFGSFMPIFMINYHQRRAAGEF